MSPVPLYLLLLLILSSASSAAEAPAPPAAPPPTSPITPSLVFSALDVAASERPALDASLARASGVYVRGALDATPSDLPSNRTVLVVSFNAACK